MKILKGFCGSTNLSIYFGPGLGRVFALGLISSFFVDVWLVKIWFSSLSPDCLFVFLGDWVWFQFLVVVFFLFHCGLLGGGW